ncbi:MAG: M1 family metallopeptidase [Aureispira sp.]|nr:M1 family metallopeptidase [Aureispira sp.]
MLRTVWILLTLLIGQSVLQAQVQGAETFKQLYEELPTPNVYHNAAGGPGHAYWQQKADYQMKIRVDDEKQRIYGEETITYYNNSPDVLTYLWVQLDQNVRAKTSDSYKIRTNKVDDGEMASYELLAMVNKFDGGFNIEHVKGEKGKDLPYVINKTMMRIDLPEALQPKASVTFSIKWWYNVNDGLKTFARSGYEYFPEDKNYMYNIAQFFPRMAVYSEVDGWQNKQFLGRGEFALTFGDYDVEITVPGDHVVAATGELQNAKDVLTKEQLNRLKKAKTADQPVMIITKEEALDNQKDRDTKTTKTWKFRAENVRDFAFASSRKYVWDAQGVPFGNRVVLGMSYYPVEGMPLWDKYSTRAVVQTLKTYSKHTFDYPYPVAISTHCAFTGMEYPMICFNFGRPRSDGSYSARTKYRMIGVIIHEIGHNYFPMIVNSDERQWTWMDEGLNTFLQYLTECEWERNFPSRRGPAHKIVDYMKGDKNGIVPIMTNSESILQFGNNAYGKPATALNILRETVMGRELFDYAFKEYAQRWMFKHPTPADFFRTMEDASGVDLDWFWRGWFYTTDHVDIALKDVKWYKLNTHNTEMEVAEAKKWADENAKGISAIRNEKIIKETVMSKNPELKDKYNDYDPFKATPRMKERDQAILNNLSEDEKALLKKEYHYYEVSLSNIGGLVMPVILEFKYEDGTEEVQYIPAEIWRHNSSEISKVFITEKPLKEMVLDPYLETADTDRSNNYFPERKQPSRFELYNGGRY